MRLALLLTVLLTGVTSAQTLQLDTFEPQEISALGGTPFTLTGSGFASPVTVRIGTFTATVLSVTPDLITGTTPTAPPSTDPQDVTVILPGGVTEVLSDAALFVGPLDITGATPEVVVQTVPTEVVLSGVGFTPGAEVEISGQLITPVTYVSHSELRVTVDTLPLGFQEVRVIDEDTSGVEMIVVLEPAESFAVIPPVTVDALADADVSALGGTPFTLTGAQFTTETTVSVAGVAAEVTFVSPTELQGVAPVPVDVILDQVYPIEVSDPFFGNATLLDGFRYVGFAFEELEPAVAPAGVENLVVVYGSGFTPDTTVEIGGVGQTVSYLDPFELEVLAVGDPGVHEVRIGDTNPEGVEVTLSSTITFFADTASIDAVRPAVVCPDGIRTITVLGHGFLPESTATVNGTTLNDIVVDVTGTRLTGVLPAGAGTGAATVAVSDFRGTVASGGLLELVGDCGALPAPEQFETSLASGEAWFSWFNPESYASIQVWSESGQLLDTLPGDATFYACPAPPGTSEVELHFQGTSAAGESSLAEAIAQVFPCDYPPPLGGRVQHGDLDLFVYGGHSAATVERCSDGVPLFGVYEPPLFQQLAGSIGFVRPHRAAVPAGEQKLTIGFTLAEDAEILEFTGYYQKLATDFGLELRGHLIQVFPDTGFHDEFSFPDPIIGDPKKDHSVSYYRATEDVASPDAMPCESPSGGLALIPAGEYRLEIYAVGGQPEIPYYVFGDDPRDNPTLIAGVSCPPYPLVRVRNLTGIRTLPDVKSVEPLFANETPSGTVVTVLSARGNWFDEDGNEWSIDPFCDNPVSVRILAGNEIDACLDPPYFPSPVFEYCWSIRSLEPAVCKVDGPVTTWTLPDWGCYTVDLTVRDKACGLSRTFSRELAIVPTADQDICVPGYPDYSFRYPTPDPASMRGIVNVQNLPNGNFDGVRELSMRILVVPQCYCDATPGCAAALIDGLSQDVEFQLAAVELVGIDPIEYAYHDLGAEIVVEDLCPNVVDGPKYYQVTIPDIGEIANHPALDPYFATAATFRAKVNCVRALGPGGETVCLPPTDSEWRPIGRFLNLYNAPEVLGNAHWTGFFEPETASYHFTVQSSPDPTLAVTLPDAGPLDFGLADAGIPLYDHQSVNAGLVSRFRLQKGAWSFGDTDAVSGGNLLGNEFTGTPQQLDGSAVSSGSPFDPPYYEWCQEASILDVSFSEELFESLIYAGFVGPIQVNIWGSVGFGLRILVDAYARSRVAPFGELPTGGFADIQYTLDSQVSLSLPCSLTADILGGIASVVLSLVPEVDFQQTTSVGAIATSSGITPTSGHFTHAELRLIMEASACVQTVILGEQCTPPIGIELVEADLMGPAGGGVPPIDGCGGTSSATAARGGAPAAALGAGVVEAFLYQQASMPATLVSPDQQTVVDIYAFLDGLDRSLRIEVTEIAAPSQVIQITGGPNFYLIDPAAAFIAPDRCLVATTGPSGGLSTPSGPDDLATQNLNAARAEIFIGQLQKNGGVWSMPATETVVISDDPGTPDVDRVADGGAAVAGDPVNQEALVAWVRYAEDYLEVDGPGLLYGTSPSCDFLCLQPADPVVPNMDATTIAVRRVNGGGLMPGQGITVISEPGLNVQPHVAFSPSGNTGYCVWVHDPVHNSLTETNLGRFLRYAIYDRVTDTWSAPMDVLLEPDEYPALLEPQVLLTSDDDGMVAFTCVEAGSPTRDSGLGHGSRLLYGARLVNGVFQEPELIRGRCEERVYGFRTGFAFEIPNLENPTLLIGYEPPEIFMSFQQVGPAGLPSGSGNVMVTGYSETTGWSPPRALLPPGRIMSNVAATVFDGSLHSIHLDEGPALTADLMFGAPPLGYVVENTPLLPDAAIVACRISDPFAGPGVDVTVEVEVENRGLVSTGFDLATDQSVLELELRRIDADGLPTLVETAVVPVLAPEERFTVAFSVESSHRPGRLVATLVSPEDANPTNNSESCPFGTPPPELFGCETVELPGEGALGVELRWQSPVNYDALWLYRDGSMVHVLPGSATSFVDAPVAEGTTTYELRGVIGASKSVRTSLVCVISSAPPAPRFLRGDLNADQGVNIADVIYGLDYQFVGGEIPPCFASADVNGDGGFDIADAVSLLGYLFQGLTAPTPPFPACGESDLTSDVSLGCEEEGCAP